MLKIFDKNHNAIGHIVKYRDCKIESEVATGDKTLSFVYLAKHHSLQNEMYVQTKDDEYVIKEVPGSTSAFPQIVAVLNLEDLQRDMWQTFSVTDVTIDEAVRTVLAGTGWTIGYCDATKKRNAGMVQVSTLGVIQNLCTAFMCEPVFDTINKTVSFYKQRGEDKGVYFLSGLNLKKLQKTSNSYDYYTRIIPIGQNGLTIEDVNDGKNYLENYQYSDKILTYIWKDESYTDAQALMEDAELKLDDLSKPVVSYQASVRDLAKQKEEYEVFSYGLGDTVTVIDQQTGTREKQRIKKMTEYPQNPEKNTCEIANTALTFEEMQQKYQAAADIINYTVAGDGRYTGTISVSDILQFEQGVAGSSTVSGINSSITTMQGDIALVKLQVGDLTVNALTAEEADLKYATISSLDATDATVHSLQSDYATFTTTTTAELSAQRALIDELDAATLKTTDLSAEVAALGYATVTELEAATARISTLESDALKTADLSAEVAKLGYATVEQLNAANAEISTLSSKAITTDNLSAQVATLGYATVTSLTAAIGRITDLETTTLKTADLSAEVAKLGYATVDDLDAVNAEISTLKANQITTTFLEANYAAIDLANVKDGSITTAMIGTGAVQTAQIADGSITDAKIVGLTANKITAGTLDAGTIEVINLNAANITVGTINGQQIASGAIDVSKLSDALNTTISTTETTANSALTNAATAQTTADTAVSNAAAAQSTADTALANAASAESLANSALASASNAQTTADGKNTVFYQTSAPSASGRKTNDIWFDTDDGNKMYYWSGSAWTAAQFGADAITDGIISADKISADVNAKLADAFTTAYSASSAASAAQTAADTAVADAAAAQSTADTAVSDAANAQSTADTAKANAATAQSTANTAKTNAATAQSTADTAVSSAAAAQTTANTAVTNAATAQSTAEAAQSAADAAQTTADTAVVNAATAQTTADGKNTVFYQTSAPSTSGRKTNDIWFDTDDGNKMYYWSGSAWTAKQFGTNAIANLAITNALIADATIESAKIAALDAAKITSGYISVDRLQAGTITAAKLASKTITAASGVIADAAILTANIADLAVSTAKIANAAIGTAKIADLAVTNAKIADLSITNAKIADATIESAKIANLDAAKITSGYISADRINAGSITYAKLDSAAVAAINALVEVGGRNLIRNTRDMDGYTYGSTVTVAEDSEGFAVATFSATDTLEWRVVRALPPIQYSAVRGQTVTLSLYVRSDEHESLNADTSQGLHLSLNLCTSTSVTRTLYAGKSYYTTQLTDEWMKISWTLQVTDSVFTYGSGTIDDTTRIYVSAYNYSLYQLQIKKIKLELGNKATDWTPAPEDVTADIEEQGIGNWCYNNDLTYINGGKIYTGTVTAAAIAASAITTDKLAASAVTAAKIAASAITADAIAASAVTTDKIAASAITAAKIAARTITADKIVAGAITANEIAAATITANEIAANTITAANIAAGAVATSELAASAVTAAKIAAGAITTDKLAANAVTAAKIDVTDLFAQDITASGTITGATLVGGSLTTTDGTRKTAVSSGKIRFYKEDSITGGISPILWGNDEDQEGIMFYKTMNATYMAIAYESSSSKYSAAYIVNDGMNPDGYTELNLFYKTSRFMGNVAMGANLTLDGGNGTGVNITNGTYTCGLHMGSGGVNRGLYDNTLGKWMVYADASSVYLNGNAATASQIYSTNVSPTAATIYYIPFHSSASTGNQSLRNDNGLWHVALEGTADANGYSVLCLGNATAAGTAGNKYGRLRLYSKSTSYGYLEQADTTSELTHTLPATSGTLLNTGTTSYTASENSTGNIGVLELNGTSYTLTDLFVGVQGVSLGSDVDLNDYTSPGIYYSRASSNSATLTNPPLTTSGFRFITLAGYGGTSSYGYQLAFGSNAVFWRSMGASNANPSAWRSWPKFTYGTAVGSSTKPAYLSSDGTVTECGSSLAVSITGVAAKSTKLASQTSATSCSDPGLYLIHSSGSAVGDTADYSADTPNLYSEARYGTILRVKYNNTSDYYTDFFADANAAKVLYKTVKNGTSLGWIRILDSGNYSSYALPLTGGTLTGTLNLTTGLTMNGVNLFNKISGDVNHTYNWGCTGGGTFIPQGDGTTWNAASAGTANIGSTTNYINSLYYGGSLSKQSDRRLKNDLGDLSESDSLTILRGSKMKRFTYLTDKDQMIQYGAYAQDLRDLLISSGIGHIAALGIDLIGGEDPERTKDLTCAEDQVRYTIDYEQYIAPLVVGWQYHDRELSMMVSRMDSYDDQLAQIRSDYAQIKAENAQIKAENEQLRARIIQLEEQVA